ncbi:S1 family peptidase [Polymorphospora sp. NPDC051019]|uniref:S1 family peptidase n=1 Tax=Polymorphospora sp. NPDC051019 TaxID=3155725 RepID=UPI00344A8D87
MARRLPRILAAALLAAGLSAAVPPATAASAATAGAAPPTTLSGQIRGGDTLIGAGGRCVVGFTVPDGFLASSVCGPAGTTITTTGGVAVGQIVASAYPQVGYVLVDLNPGWVPVGQVRVAGGTVAVKGANPAPVGALVCRSGPTSGWRCGPVTGLNQTVNFPGGAVPGLTRANICAEAGEVGTPYLTASGQAQGVHVGGSGTCPAAGTSYFLPVRPALAAYGVALLTA